MSVRLSRVKALRRFTVRAHLPDRLTALERLSINLRWSWDKPTQDLFEAVDPELWKHVGCDPVALLGQVAPKRLDELAKDESFLRRLDELAADLDNYLTRPLWYQQQAEEGAQLPNGIAYFSMEFGVAEVLPNYSGGLGILAGDHLKSASDLGLPLIAVGLYYRSGYFRQSLTADGWQHENYPSLDPQGLPLRLLTDGDNDPVLVELALPDSGRLRAYVWIAQVGRIPLLLLDSDIPENEHDLRSVTDRLYGGDQEHRIKQEILAGIGGVRAIRAFTEVEGLPAPEVFHMNEGHAGFLGVERIRELIDAGLDFDTALTVVRSSTVFTTHTPVPAGIDRFPVEMVKRYFGGSADGPSGAMSRLLPGVPLDRIVAFGEEDDPAKFNMAHMGLRLAQRANGVSLLHGRVSRHMFNELWPGFDTERGADRLDHQRCARADLGGAAVDGTWPRADRQRGPRLAERARHVAAAAAGRHRPHVVDPLAVAQGPCRRRASPDTALVAGAWRLGCRIGLDRNGVRSRRADHRVRPASADLQAPDADAA